MNAPLQLGRYSLFAELASGGMATVYIGRLNSEAGFGRVVAIKRLHPHLAREPQFVSMFLDEARLAARIQHPNVVPILDVVTLGTELFLVMEYVKGESLVALLRETATAGATVPIPVVATIAMGLLAGLHAAHEATDEAGRSLGIVHRDVSPQNLLVGIDGVARVLDFGIAKASVRLQTTREGQLKGKLAYMAPEQVSGQVTRRTDIYAAGIVLWEALACRRMFRGETEAHILQQVMAADFRPPSLFNPEVPPELDRVVLRALSKDPEARYATARDMAADLDRVLRPASAMTVADWVEKRAGEALASRSQLVTNLETTASRRLQAAALTAPTIDSPTAGSLYDKGVATGAPTSAPSLPSAARAASGEQADGVRIAAVLGGSALAFMLTCALLVWAIERPTGPVSGVTASPALATEVPAPPAASVAPSPSPSPQPEVPSAAPSSAASTLAHRPDAAAVGATSGRPPSLAPPRPPRSTPGDAVDPFRGSRK